MSQQVPYDNNGVPMMGNEMTAPGGYADVAPGGYLPQEMSPAGYNMSQNVPADMDPYGGGGDGGYYQPPQPPQPPQGPQTYARNSVPMIDPIESAKLTPQILVLLVISGLKRHWKWSLPMGLILGLLTAGGLYLAFPLQYESRASIQMRSTKLQFLSANTVQGGYDNFVNTQFAYMRSPAVIDRALEDPEVAKLSIVLKQKDRRGWLTKNLRIKSDGKSEIVIVSIETDAEDASEKIVNAVVNAYLQFIEELERGTNQTMLSQLQIEKRRQQMLAQGLQESIRTNTKKAAGQGGVAGNEGMIAGLGQGESLLRDLSVHRSQLVALQARKRAADERQTRPQNIPMAVLLQSNPEFASLTQQRAELVQRKEGLASTLRNKDDPSMLVIDQQIARLDDQLKKITGTSNDDSGMAGMVGFLQAQAQIDSWTLEQDILTQQIMVEEVERRYAEQLATSADRSETAVDVSFDVTQLARTNKTIDQIDDRILTIQSEQRAPGQINQLTKAVNATPSRTKQIMTVGMGAVMLSVFPMLFSIAVERMKPRLYHVSQVRRAVPQVLIGEIMEPPVSWVHGATFRKRLARYRESVHNWCTHLLLSDPFRSCKTLAVASVAGDDGKTFLAVQIAVAMAQMKEGRVLLIDGDMRVGRLHLLFGNEETGIGLADVLSFRNRPGEAIVQNEKEPNLELLSAGQLDVTPYELLGDGRFRELLDSLEMSPSNPGGYSLIIVVLPPVANAAESLIMAASTDSTLLCVRQGETVLAAMEDVYRKLVNTGASVDGIVVKDIPYYQMAGRDGGFADKLEQIRLSHLLQYTD